MAYKILIVDDSKLARMSVNRVLNVLRPDWERIEATNGAEALALARRSRVDIALLDFNMPGDDGLTIAAQLREIQPDMPMAIISANHQEEIVERTTRLGATFLPKPLTEQALAGFLDAVAPRAQTACL